jgi:sulfite reductase beta subunit-like hemoprotein
VRAVFLRGLSARLDAPTAKTPILTGSVNFGSIEGMKAPTLDLDEDIAKFDVLLADYLAGRLDEDAFRIFRLNNGIYGQRQGGRNHMVRVKAPYGSLNADQLELLGDVAERFSRGWGHLTTRQNVQFHFVQLERIPELLRSFASVGMTTREACGDTVRNVAGCHLAGACPHEVLDVSPWAEATFQHFLHHPYGQRLPRKFKINFSGCATDCGQAMFNDVGVVGISRPLHDGTTEPGFRVFLGGGLGANPHPAQALEPFTSREQLLATIEAVLRTFDHYGNRENKLRARLKWLVDELGIDELRRRILRERATLIASSSWPGGVPAIVEANGDARAGASATRNATPVGTPVTLRLKADTPYARWRTANVVDGLADGSMSAIAHAPLGDVTGEQFRGLAAAVRALDADVRITNRQNFVFRGLDERVLPELHRRLEAIQMADPGAELARDVVSCPGADTCNLAVTQSRGLGAAISDALEEAGLGDVGGIRINISGCTNSCGHHHVADIGFHGVERRVNGRPAPGYQLLLGGHVGAMEAEFAQRAMRLPAKACPDAVVRLVGRFAEERALGASFPEWLAAAGGAKAVAASLADLDEWPTAEERPDYYVDFDETGPYVAEVGQGECAGT